MLRAAVSFGIAVIVILFVQDTVFHFGFFERTSLTFIDRAFEKRGPLSYSKDSLDVIIISISDKSETTVPDRFPFPRSYYARAIRNLNRAGAQVIGIDLTFEQTDTHGPYNDDELFKTIQQYRNVIVAGKTDLRRELHFLSPDKGVLRGVLRRAGSMRASTSSRSMKWCLSAAPRWAITRAAMPKLSSS